MTLSFLAIKLQQSFGLGPAMIGARYWGSAHCWAQSQLLSQAPCRTAWGAELC